jgi:hypothetical protein
MPRVEFETTFTVFDGMATVIGTEIRCSSNNWSSESHVSHNYGNWEELYELLLLLLLLL